MEDGGWRLEAGTRRALAPDKRTMLALGLRIRLLSVRYELEQRRRWQRGKGVRQKAKRARVDHHTAC